MLWHKGETVTLKTKEAEPQIWSKFPEINLFIYINKIKLFQGVTYDLQDIFYPSILYVIKNSDKICK